MEQNDIENNNTLLAEIQQIRQQAAEREAELLQLVQQLKEKAYQQDKSQTVKTIVSDGPTLEVRGTKESLTRPKPKLPDVPQFDGNRAEWRGWKLEMENKLAEDADALGNELSRFRYVFSRLKGNAKDNVTTFVELGVKNANGTTKELLFRLDLLYGQRDRKQRAIQNLG
ncbi:pol-like protein, partial [Colletotrichum plurivorum]